MGANTAGILYQFTTFGESHGKALGCVIDGFPSNVEIDLDFIQSEMDRRRPGGNKLGTQRMEGDKIQILSGIFEGRSTGSPIALIIENENQQSKDYSDIASIYRPGHADYTFDKKYGIRDYRGGGRSSGRETAARVAAGAFAKLYLKTLGIKINAAVVEVGAIKATGYSWNPPFDAPLFAPSCKERDAMINEIEKARESKDSVGAVIECHIEGVPAGLGNPVFDKLDARLASAIFSLGAVKGFEVGRGFESARLKGSENNDQMRSENGKAVFLSNNAGGILGGISNGENIVFRAAFKPTPSIALAQKTITKELENTEIEIKGRHDPCIAPRAVVVVEAMAATVILDEILISRAYNG